jgi:hypothetical protein
VSTHAAAEVVTTKNSLRNEGTCPLTAKAVGTCRQAGRGVDGCEFAVGGL